MGGTTRLRIMAAPSSVVPAKAGTHWTMNPLSNNRRCRVGSGVRQNDEETLKRYVKNLEMATKT